MKISDTKNQASEIIQQYQANNEKAISDTNKQSNGNVVPEEKVSISAQGKEIQQLRKVVEDLPDVRQDKVTELKAQLEQGMYEVDGGKVAEKMLKESLIDIIA